MEYDKGTTIDNITDKRLTRYKVVDGRGYRSYLENLDLRLPITLTLLRVIPKQSSLYLRGVWAKLILYVVIPRQQTQEFLKAIRVPGIQRYSKLLEKFYQESISVSNRT